MKKERNLTMELQKEGLKALKIYNGMLIGSAVMTVAGLGIMGYIAVKQKLGELEDDGLWAPSDSFAGWIQKHKTESDNTDENTEDDTPDEE